MVQSFQKDIRSCASRSFANQTGLVHIRETRMQPILRGRIVRTLMKKPIVARKMKNPALAPVFSAKASCASQSANSAVTVHTPKRGEKEREKRGRSHFNHADTKAAETRN